MIRTATAEPIVESYRVLVVDDEPEVLQSIADILCSAKYQVTCVSTPEQARRLLAEERFDLALTDLYLGEQHLGYEVAEAARRCTPTVPVILLTGRPSFLGAQEAFRSQVCEIVVKPVSAVDLVQTCQRTIRQSLSERRQRELEGENKILSAVLPRAIEAKDPTTSGHAERVVQYTDNLAQRCGVSEEDRGHLRLASLLHDVGKIGIPEQILTKNGPLTRDERDVIETHPEHGRQILAALDDSHRKVCDWVYQHHERWDGRGYPNGLAREEVDLPGRILVLAEVYDALAEERSYKPRWPNEKIVHLFRKEAGTHFDPELAKMVADGIEREGDRFFRAAPGQLF